MTMRVDVRRLREYWQPDENGTYLGDVSFDPHSGGSTIARSGSSPSERAAERRKPKPAWSGLTQFTNIRQALLRFSDLSPRDRRALIEAVPVELRNEPLSNGKSAVANDYYYISLLGPPVVTVRETGIERIIAVREKQGEPPMREDDDTDVVLRHHKAKMAPSPTPRLYQPTPPRTDP
jgi:hypothetical protein